MHDVTLEPLEHAPDVSLERIRYRDDDGTLRSLVLKRVPRERSLEVQLLPFLARKSAHVLEVRSRGVPPPLVPAKPWLLLEDVESAPTGCSAGVRAVLEALVEVRRAVSGDVPALRALGVREVEGIPARLRGRPSVLVHGDLRCANTRLLPRGVVLTEWGSAHLGPALLDLVRLRADAGDEAVAAYAALTGEAVDPADLAAAEALDALFSASDRE